MKSKLDQIIEEVTSRTLVGSISLSIEKIAEEIAKEALSDEEFRESLRALTRASAKRIMANLAAEDGHPPSATHPQTPNNLRKNEG